MDLVPTFWSREKEFLLIDEQFYVDGWGVACTFSIYKSVHVILEGMKCWELNIEYDS